MNYISLSVTALIPAVLLCVYIYLNDRVEKEPVGLLALLFGAGAVGMIPAMFGEKLLLRLVETVFSPLFEYSVSLSPEFASAGAALWYSAVCGIAIALAEEGVKWLLLFFITRNNKNFSHIFDGVVYAVVISLGFAAMENICFVMTDGWDTFAMRLLTSLPGHMCFGVIMGYFYTMCNAHHLASAAEKKLEGLGHITPVSRIRPGLWLGASIVFPVLTHGFYSFVKLVTYDLVENIFHIFVAVLYIVCLVGIRRISDVDTHEDNAARRILLGRYPALRELENFNELTDQDDTNDSSCAEAKNDGTDVKTEDN